MTIRGTVANERAILITVLNEDECDSTITVYEFITPDGNGKNDWLHVKNIHLSNKKELRVYNRHYQEVFYQEVYDNRWDGGELPQGIYFYELILDTEKKKGSLMIRR